MIESQFRSKKMQKAITRHGMLGSMGRVGACGDNAAMESFFSLLQNNVLDRRSLYCPETLIEPPRPWRSCSDTTVVVRQVTVSGPGLP